MTPEIKQRLLPDGRPNKPGKPMTPKWVTMHNTDNTASGATAESHARYILNGSGGREVSWHYTVDDKEIYQHLRDNEQGWHAGDDDGSGNTTSIGIEVCMYQGMDEPKAWQRAAELVAVLLRRHGLTIDKVVPHKHWSGKRCPSRILPHWSKFIQMVKDELKKLQPQKAHRSASASQAKEWPRSKRPSMQAPKQPGKPALDYNGHWAKASIKRVIDEGIMGGRTVGFAPNEPITRAEMAVVVDRLMKRMEK